MRFSSAFVALAGASMANAATSAVKAAATPAYAPISQIGDGQIQGPTNIPAPPPPPPPPTYAAPPPPPPTYAAPPPPPPTYAAPPPPPPPSYAAPPPPPKSSSYAAPPPPPPPSYPTGASNSTLTSTLYGGSTKTKTALPVPPSTSAYVAPPPPKTTSASSPPPAIQTGAANIAGAGMGLSFAALLLALVA